MKSSKDLCQARTISLPQVIWDFINFKAQGKSMSRSEYIRKHFQNTFGDELKNFQQPNRPLRDLSLR